MLRLQGKRLSGIVKCLLLLLLFVALTSAKSVASDGLSEEQSYLTPGVLGVLACVAAVVCMIVVLVGCADICNREVAFKDFENDDVFSTEVESPPAMVPSEFTMYPPMESTPDAIGPIVFEPLPDPVHLKRNLTGGQTHNVKQLRPKVALNTRSRTESEDSLDDAFQQPQQYDVAHKLKLHNLLVNSRNQIPRSQLQYIKELGNGWFGKVLQGEGQRILPGHKKTKVVIQMLKEDSDSADQLAFLEEGSPYRDVDSANVLRLLGQCVDTSPYLTILELCPFGDVKTYLRSHRIAVESFNEKGLLLKFACDMAAGLQALNQQGYIHRDFAARNCLLASDLSVKVGDYGLSEETFKEDYYVDSDGSNIPVRWLPPEALHVYNDGGVILKRLTKEANVWSFGVTLWEVITFGSLPYRDLSNEHVLRLVIRERSLKPNKPDMPVSHLDRLYELMQLCWSDVPANRPSLRELRIMMLHLMSSKMTADSTAFDQKWNQLMPRKAPQVAKVAPQPQYNHPSHSSIGTIGTIDDSLTIDPIADPLKATNGGVTRPTRFDSSFSELNPSLLGNAGSLDSTPVSEMPQVHRPPTTPLNNLSLDAELNAVMGTRDGGGGDGKESKPSKVETPANELSLAAELSQLAPSPPDSETGDDVIEIHAEDPGAEVHAFAQDTPLSPVKPEGGKVHVMIHTPGDGESDPKGDSQGKRSETSTPEESESSGEFFTSTPVKSEPPEIAINPEAKDGLKLDKRNFTTPISGPNSAQNSAPNSASSTANTDQLSSSFYQTALSAQTSTEDEPSILGQRKFAACLQTVVTSFDGDEFDPLSLSGSVDEEVFRISHPSIPEKDEEDGGEGGEDGEGGQGKEEEEDKNETITEANGDSSVFDDTKEVTPTHVTPTASGVTPTATDVTPTATDVTPTATDVTPTSTDVTPTSTDVTPTATDVTPTATDVTPTTTATDVTPTAVIPTATDVTPMEEPSDIFEEDTKNKLDTFQSNTASNDTTTKESSMNENSASPQDLNGIPATESDKPTDA